MHRLSRLIGVLTQKRGIKTFFRLGRRFSIAAFKIVHGLRAQGLTPDLIIDAGANVGQFTCMAAYTFPNCQIDSFEPFHNSHAQLTRNAHSFPNVSTHQMALGSNEGELEFHLHSYSHLNSFLQIHKHNTNPKYKGKEIAKKTDIVKVNTIDNLYTPEQLDGVSVLKMDVQGYELEVLSGAKKTLPNIDYVVLEVSFESLYENQPTFEELHGLLVENGFVLSGLLDTCAGLGGRFIEADLLFSRERPQL